MTDTPTVFLVDDDDDVRVALGRSLRMRGLNVESYSDARSFLDATDRSSGGCLILDYGMPGMDGLELQEHLIEIGSDLPIIFITGHGGIPQSVKATKLGALDFLEKPFDLGTLLERIDTAFEIWRTTSEEKQRKSQLEANRQSLTTREGEVFDHILRNPSRSTSKEIARALNISARTVEIHRGRVMKKLNVNSVAELFDVYSGT